MSDSNERKEFQDSEILNKWNLVGECEVDNFVILRIIQRIALALMFSFNILEILHFVQYDYFVILRPCRRIALALMFNFHTLEILRSAQYDSSSF